MFFCFCSFGKQFGGKRGCDCLVLEPSEMIVVRRWIVFWYASVSILTTVDYKYPRQLPVHDLRQCLSSITAVLLYVFFSLKFLHPWNNVQHDNRDNISQNWQLSLLFYLKIKIQAFVVCVYACVHVSLKGHIYFWCFLLCHWFSLYIWNGLKERLWRKIMAHAK